jgi:hypothetical protein
MRNRGAFGWCIALAVVVSLAALPHLVLQAQPKGQKDQKDEQPLTWPDTPDRAEVLAATFLGGKGHEWLVAGGFAPDGTVVLVGNVLGPTLDLPVPVRVLGEDLPPPQEPKRVPVKDKAGQPKVDKQGQPIYEKPSWRHEGTTGFVVRLSGDLQKVLSAHRLPWTAAALTSAVVGPDGAIYIAGRATDAIGKLGGDVAEQPVPPEATRKGGSANHAFVAKLTPTADKVVWVRHTRGATDAPHLTLTDNGLIKFAAQDLRTLDAAGKLVGDPIVIPGGVRRTTSVSPKDGRIVVGGEHNQPTGREPWRCPILNVHTPDGKLQHQLYDWGGPHVGLDNLREVSDSAVRLTTHDKDGNILIYAWSDGGNSVMRRQPTDIRTLVPLKGLGLTSAGANVLSLAYLIRIEPKDYRVTGWTLWSASRGVNKPNSIWIDTLGQAPDGSVCVAGRSAYGLIQTKNHLGDAAPAGPYVAVFSGDLSVCRYCTALPGAGVTLVGDGEAAWGIVSGLVQGKPRVLFVGGAVKDAESYGKQTETPTVNALQAKFGGGFCDGYIVALDLSKTDPNRPAPSATVENPGSARFELAGVGAARGSRSPEVGAVFHFTPNYPKYVTVDAEFRDRDGKYWPHFVTGRPVSGKLTVQKDRLQGELVIRVDTYAQPRGDQSRRVLGELFGNGNPPPITLTLESFGEVQTVAIPPKSGKGKATQLEYRTAKAKLDIGGKQVAITPKVVLAYSAPKKDQPVDTLRVTSFVSLPARELGLTKLGDALVDVRISCSGSIHEKAPPKK